MNTKSRTYKEMKATKTYVVLTKNGKCWGVFSNLRTAVETVRSEDNCFPSYWTLIRKEKPLVVLYENDSYIFSEHHINVLEEITLANQN